MKDYPEAARKNRNILANFVDRIFIGIDGKRRSIARLLLTFNCIEWTLLIVSDQH